MVSCGPDVQNCNFTHMSYFNDLHGDKVQPCMRKNSLYWFLFNNGEFSKFLRIVDRAKMIGQLNKIQADFTLFVPRDQDLKHIPEAFFEFMDDGLAKQIFNASCMNRRISGNLLVSSPVSYYATLNSEMRMYVTNIFSVSPRDNGEGITTEINKCARVLKYDVLLDNGLIHIIDNIIVPNGDHFMN